MARSDDLAQVLRGDLVARPHGAAQPMKYRQAKVLSWDPVTLENVLSIDGEEIPNVPVLGVAEADSITAGSVVGVMVVGSTWAIIGRLVVPGTPEATDAITRVSQRIYTATKASAGNVTSLSFVDMPGDAGPEVTATIGASGRALVFLTAGMSVEEGGTAMMGFDVPGGPEPLPDVFDRLSITGVSGVGNAAAFMTKLREVSGLTPGENTFVAKYSSGSSTATASFIGRNITVYAL